MRDKEQQEGNKKTRGGRTPKAEDSSSCGGRLRRLAAVGLTLLLILQGALYGFADEIEFYDIFTKTIRSMEAVGGTLNKPFTETDHAYGLTLTSEEESFALRFDLPTGDIGPDLLVEVSEGNMGSPAQREELGQRGTTGQIAVQPGEARTVTVTPTPQQSMSNASTVEPYTVQVYRSTLTVDCRVSDIQSGAGGDFLTVTVHVEPADGQSVWIRGFKMALGFDPEDVKLADKDSNTATTNFLQYAVPRDGLLGFSAMDIDQPMQYEAKLSKAENSSGKLVLHFGVNTNAESEKRKLEVPAEGLDLMTLYFRVMEEKPSFDPQTLCILRAGDERSENPVNGVAIDHVVEGGSPFDATAPSMIGVSGLERYQVYGLESQQENGSLSLSPGRELFCEGEAVSIEARADAGYEFVRWELPDSLTPEDMLENRGQTLRLSIRRDLDLSALRAVFQEAAGELTSGAIVDRDPPYYGDLLLAVNAPTAGSITVEGTGLTGSLELMSTLGGGQPEALCYTESLEEMERDRIASFSQNGWSLSSGEDASQTEPKVGEVREFKARDMTAATEGSLWFTKSFALLSQTEHLNIWLDPEDEMGKRLTQAQKAEMTEEFEENWRVISQNYHSLYDSDGNGRLDVLLYDIPDHYDTTNQYYQGMFSFSELYGRSAGNSGNFIHLDTWPTMRDWSDASQTHPGTGAAKLERVISTMAHETGHLAFASYFQDRGAVMTDSELTAAMPNWIAEGISMSIEDERFGALQSRIQAFNGSESIRNGAVPLTVWQGTIDSYALTYVFFQYLIHQAEEEGAEGFTAALIQSYENGLMPTLLSTLHTAGGFDREKSFDELAEDFYTAVVLKEASGAYGFANDPDFDSINLRPATSRSVSLAPGAGVVFRMNEDGFTPKTEGSVRFAGLTVGDYTLSVSAEYGSVEIEGGKVRFRRGADETAVITAVPGREGWTFLGWKGDAAGTENPLRLTMDRSKNVVAVFERTNNAGELLPPGNVTYEDGEAEVNVTGGSIRLSLASGEELTPATVIEPGTPIRLKAAASDSSLPFLYWVEKLPGAGEPAESVSPAALRSVSPAAVRSTSPETLLGNTEIGAEMGEQGAAETRYYANPAVFSYKEGASYTAVFGKLETAPDSEASLTALWVSAPDNKVLLQRALVGGTYVEALQRNAYGETGFSDGVGAYDLYLLSGEAAKKNLTFRMTWKKGQTLEASCEGNTASFTAGDPAAGLESDLLQTTEFTLPMADISDGSQARFTVTDPDTGKTRDYLIYIHENTANQDPLMTMRVEAVEQRPGLYRMEMSLKNLWLGAVNGGLRITGSAIRPADVSAIADLTAATDAQWAAVTALDWSDSSLEQAFVLRPESELVFTHRWAELLGTDQILRFGFDPGKTAGTGGVATESSPVNLQEDTVIAELYFFCDTIPGDCLALLSQKDVTEMGGTGASGGGAEAGDTVVPGRGPTANTLADIRYTAYETQVRLVTEGEVEISGSVCSYDPKKEIKILLAAQTETGELDPSQTYDGRVEALDEGTGETTQTFSLRVTPGIYTMVFEKRGHLRMSLSNLKVTSGGLNLKEALTALEEQAAGGEPGARPAGGLAGGRIRSGVIYLLPGDVNGDGRIALEDKNLLMSPMIYGKPVPVSSGGAGGTGGSGGLSGPAAADSAALCDLDGDGRVTLLDLNILMSPFNFGKGSRTMEMPASTGEGD